jgi:hypothetical protein
MNWYNDYAHLGYDWDGKKVMRPLKEDELDNFLKRMEDPNFWYVGVSSSLMCVYFLAFVTLIFSYSN